MPALRHERVRELLKRALGEIIRREIPPGEETGLITVNDVGLAADLHSAKVFYGVVGGAAQRKRADSLLADQRGRIQSLLGKAVVLKYTPTIKFVPDNSAQHADRVLSILEELDKTSPPADTEASEE